MQNYTTIIGVIELRSQKCSYDTVQKRYSIGSGTVTLIMNRYKQLGMSLDDLKQMEPTKVGSKIPLSNLVCYYIAILQITNIILLDKSVTNSTIAY